MHRVGGKQKWKNRLDQKYSQDAATNCLSSCAAVSARNTESGTRVLILSCFGVDVGVVSRFTSFQQKEEEVVRRQ